jgi:hypothetical protein
MKNMSIKARITLGLGLILLFAVLNAGFSIYRNISAKYESGEVANSWIPAIENLGHMKGFLAGQQRPVGPHRSTGQRAGANRRLDGAAGLHRAPERRQRAPGQPAGHVAPPAWPSAAARWWARWWRP